MKSKKNGPVILALVLLSVVSVSMAFILTGQKWPNGTDVSYSINPNTSQVNNEADAVIGAADSWSGIYPAGLRLSYGGSTSATSQGYNGINSVCWEDRGDSGALATAYWWYVGSTTVEADIVFNDYYNWSTSGDHYDVETVALHEIGHWVGLDHSSTGIMQASYSGIQRSIDDDARNGFLTIYAGALGPFIEVDKSGLFFSGPGQDSFMVRNSGIETLNFQIEEAIPWISASPTGGSSTGEWETITVLVDSTGLGLGTYSGTLSVTSGDAINSPVIISVELELLGDQPPFVAISTPQNGHTVYESTVIDIVALDDIGIDKVQIYIDDVLKHTDTSFPYSYVWDTTQHPNGSHRIRAVATDTNIQTAEDEIDVKVTNYKLNITATEGGTTDPAPGQHYFGSGRDISVQAIADLHYRLEKWSGSGYSGEANPLTVTMDADKSITAHFLRIIYPPLQFSGQKVENRSLSQMEYVNSLTWTTHPDNQGLNIVKYRIYLQEESSRIFLADVASDTLEYWHRGVEKETSYTYIIAAVIEEGREGDPASITVH